ncbi:hypothetical protein TrVGV298_007171 [Trichoderma virens]|nr:hypothetical protein TrVGV298_007171 [Trichoderma virens]
MQILKASEFSWEVCSWHDVFGLILDDEWFKMDKRKYKFVEEDTDGNEIVKTRIPDATFGLTTYDSSAIDLNREFMVAGYQADYSNKQPDDRLSKDRLKAMTHNPQCGLVVDGVWGEADIVFPFAVYEAKKRVEDYEDAKQQIQHACQIYLSMLDDLARDPKNVAKYQTEGSHPCQMFALVSHGSRWSVYMVWSSFETCHIETLWYGDVTIPTDALKLICIVDQIHDYAIQYHRPSVLNHLSSWLTWSEKPAQNRRFALFDSLNAEQKNWWWLEFDMSQLRREKMRQKREQKKKLNEPVRETPSSTQRGPEKTPEKTPNTTLNGRVTKKQPRKLGRKSRANKEAE